MSQCSIFSLTEGKQVPLPQRPNDPIISIRSLDWCYTSLPLSETLLKSHLVVYVHLKCSYRLTAHAEMRKRSWWWRWIQWEHNNIKHERSKLTKSITSPFNGGPVLFISGHLMNMHKDYSWNHIVSKVSVGVEGKTIALLSARKLLWYYMQMLSQWCLKYLFVRNHKLLLLCKG